MMINWVIMTTMNDECWTLILQSNCLLITAGQDLHCEVEHPEERGEDGEDGVKHRAQPPVEHQQTIVGYSHNQLETFFGKLFLVSDPSVK